MGLEQEVAEGESHQGLKEALQSGRFWVNFRYRFEHVEREDFALDARASTLRTRLGYESATYAGWRGTLEFSDVSSVPGGAGDYNDTINGNVDRPTIADPTSSVVNLAHATYEGFWDSEVRLGRQRIQLDSSRFIGSAPWRQTEQVFDALSIRKPDLAGLDVFYAYVDHINRPLGPRSPVGDLDSNSHLLNVGKELPGLGRLSAYGYYVDVADLPSMSTFTYGVRMKGERELEGWSALYTAELAHQSDVADNPNQVDAGYLHGVLGGRVDGLTLRAGYEVLEGGDGTKSALQTPLAARHGPNGWADVFLVTPAGGLEDLYLSVGYQLGRTELLAMYHDFQAESGDAGGYGAELDLRAIHRFECGVELGLKYADYRSDVALVAGDPYSADTRKFWAWLYYSSRASSSRHLHGCRCL